MIQLWKNVLPVKLFKFRHDVPRNYCSSPTDTKLDPKTKSKSLRDEIRVIMKERGSHCTLDISSQLPYAKSVGHIQTFHQFDDTVRRVVLPKVMYSKTKTRLTNITWKGEGTNPHITGCKTLAESAFNAGLPSISKNCLNGPNYYYEDGLRKVEPYFLGMRSTASESKFPGLSCSIVDYFYKRFPSRSRRYFNLAVKNAAIVVNLNPVAVDYVVKENDLVSHVIHRHEAPVLDRKVDILYESDELLVVDKPPSWPVHSCGNYHFNSLVFILAKDYNYLDLRTIHRLDKMTSGVCLLARGYGTTARIKEVLMSKDTKKEYLALVTGRFPEGEIACTLPIGSYKVSSLEFKPTKERNAITIFRRVRFDEKTNTSLVECILKTGRTHQIRLHFKELGFYIVNDILYNRDETSSDTRKQDIENKVQLILDKMEAEFERTMPKIQSDKVPTIADLEARFSKYGFCLNCQDSSLYDLENENLSQKIMCLHSWKYTLGGKVFQSKLPEWAEHPESIVK